MRPQVSVAGRARLAARTAAPGADADRPEALAVAEPARAGLPAAGVGRVGRSAGRRRAQARKNGMAKVHERLVAHRAQSRHGFLFRQRTSATPPVRRVVLVRHAPRYQRRVSGVRGARRLQRSRTLAVGRMGMGAVHRHGAPALLEASVNVGGRRVARVHVTRVAAVGPGRGRHARVLLRSGRVRPVVGRPSAHRGGMGTRGRDVVRRQLRAHAVFRHGVAVDVQRLRGLSGLRHAAGRSWRI